MRRADRHVRRDGGAGGPGQAERTGEGQHIDIALFDVQVATLANQAMNYLVSGEKPQRLGNAHPNIVPYQAFPTADGVVVLAVGNDEQFRRFAALRRPAGAGRGPALPTNAGRVREPRRAGPGCPRADGRAHHGRMAGALEPAGVPCGPINGLARSSPTRRCRRGAWWRGCPSPGGGGAGGGEPDEVLPHLREPGRPPPLLGEHTDAVLRHVLGSSDAEIARWRNQGAMSTAAAPVPLLRRRGRRGRRRGPPADRVRRAAGNRDRGPPRHDPCLQARRALPPGTPHDLREPCWARTGGRERATSHKVKVCFPPRLCRNAIALARRARSLRKATGAGNDDLQQACTPQQNCWLPLGHGDSTQPAPNAAVGRGRHRVRPAAFRESRLSDCFPATASLTQSSH